MIDCYWKSSIITGINEEEFDVVGSEIAKGETGGRRRSAFGSENLRSGTTCPSLPTLSSDLLMRSAQSTQKSTDPGISGGFQGGSQWIRSKPVMSGKRERGTEYVLGYI